jgi:hypothetical protein
MERKQIKKFVDDFAYKFIASECMDTAFASLTCGDAQTVRIHLYNMLDMDLQDFLDEQGLISE